MFCVSQLLYQLHSVISIPLTSQRMERYAGSQVGPYLTRGIWKELQGLSSLNLTPVLITCRISLLAPHGVLTEPPHVCCGSKHKRKENTFYRNRGLSTAPRSHKSPTVSQGPSHINPRSSLHQRSVVWWYNIVYNQYYFMFYSLWECLNKND